MAMASSLLPPFTVRRGDPVLVAPSAPTPRETKPLSDIDDSEGMRFYSSGIHLYRTNPSKAGQDPARVIREALARALVPYYPLAGRLREVEGRKLVVDCAAQGILFAEADADLTADDFGDVQSPPFPCFEQFILESTTVAGAEPVVDRPLLYVQVTRLKCGGFIFGQRFCHCIVDAPGGMQFEKAVCEIACGAAASSVAPAWGREMFMVRNPPRPWYPHLEYREPAGSVGVDWMLTTLAADMAQVPFFFGPREIAGLRQRAPPGIRCSRFELVGACIWRSRTAALGYAADEEVRLSFIVNARGRPDIPLPEGFYGNAFAYSVAAPAEEMNGGGRLVECPRGWSFLAEENYGFTKWVDHRPIYPYAEYIYYPRDRIFDIERELSSGYKDDEQDDNNNSASSQEALCNNPYCTCSNHRNKGHPPPPPPPPPPTMGGYCGEGATQFAMWPH